VRPPKTFVSRVRIEIGIGVTVVSAVTSRPPFDRTLNCSRSSESEEVLKRFRGGVSSVSPETMVTGSDTETSVEVVSDRPEDSLPLYFSRESTVDGEGRDESDGEGRNDIKVLVEVGKFDRRERSFFREYFANVVVVG